MADDKTQERKKPRSYIHEDSYVLVIDGQRKVSFVDHGWRWRKPAESVLPNPRVNIAVHDQQNDSVSTLRDDQVDGS
jgi:hypothetical protein